MTLRRVDIVLFALVVLILAGCGEPAFDGRAYPNTVIVTYTHLVEAGSPDIYEYTFRNVIAVDTMSDNTLQVFFRRHSLDTYVEIERNELIEVRYIYNKELIGEDTQYMEPDPYGFECNPPVGDGQDLNKEN